jgi:hypothetical protein
MNFGVDLILDYSNLMLNLELVKQKVGINKSKEGFKVLMARTHQGVY